MKKFLLTIASFVFSLITFAQAPLEKFQAANRLYEDKDYAAAIEVYEELLQEEYLSDDLHYNLGNAYFRSNQLAKAILHYEKALKINPAHEDASHNLAYANSRTIDRIESIPKLFLYRWWDAILHSFSSRSWSYFVILFLAFGVVGLGIYFFFADSYIKRISFYSGISSIFLSIVCWFIAASLNSSLQRIDAAIIISPTVDINSSPSEGSSRLFVLHEGSKVSIEDQSGEWYEIRLPNGNSGWVKSDELALI